jgi:hypothetical protein
VLEPDDGKPSSTVHGGLRAGNGAHPLDEVSITGRKRHSRRSKLSNIQKRLTSRNGTSGESGGCTATNRTFPRRNSATSTMILCHMPAKQDRSAQRSESVAGNRPLTDVHFRTKLTGPFPVNCIL